MKKKIIFQWRLENSLKPCAYSLWHFPTFKSKSFYKNTSLESHNSYTNFWQLSLSIHWVRKKNTSTIAVIVESKSGKSGKYWTFCQIECKVPSRRTKWQRFFPLIKEKCWVINNHLVHQVRYLLSVFCGIHQAKKNKEICLVVPYGQLLSKLASKLTIDRVKVNH